MTNKDAIYILSGLKRSLNEYCGLNTNGQKAFDMAISALQAQDVPDTNVGKINNKKLSETQKALDTISRQAAIDLAKDLIIPGADYLQHNQGIMNYEAELVRLPSAQPEKKIGKFVRWMEKRETPNYISFTPHCKCSLCGNELLIENINYCYVCGASLIEDRGTERREE